MNSTNSQSSLYKPPSGNRTIERERKKVLVSNKLIILSGGFKQKVSTE